VTNTSLKKIKRHVVIWAAFILYENLLPALYGSISSFWDYTLHYCLHIGLFYFHANVVLPVAFKGSKRRYGLLILLVTGELIFSVFAKDLILCFLNFTHAQLIPEFTGYLNYNVSGVIRTVYFLGLSTGYWFALSSSQKRQQIADLQNAKLTSDLQNRRLEKALLATENAYLKSQINPHFLLNTLNFLYNSVSRFSEKIADSVMSLSEIMHYSLSEANSDGEVPLESEIQHIQNYINLSQARFNQRLNLEFIVTGDAADKTFLALILITLVENVFKYGDLSNPALPAKILLNIKDRSLIFKTENLKKQKQRQKSTGIGIQNVRKRLGSYHYSYEIDESEIYYKAILQVQLN
jgi:two-component system LytT family sensor kinase